VRPSGEPAKAKVRPDHPIRRSPALLEPGGVRELTVEGLMLAALRLAKRGLRRRSIDEFEELLELCFKLPRD